VNLKTTAAIALFFLHASVASASSELVCEDLHKATCESPRGDDGTFTGRSVTGTTRLRRLALAEYQEILADRDTGKFRMFVIAAAGLTGECSAQKPSTDCLDRMSTYVSDLTLRSVGAANTSSRSPASLAAVTLLEDSEIFQHVRGRLSGQSRESTGQRSLASRIREDIMPDVQAMIVAKISENVEDPTVKRAMIAKVKAITFAGTDCGREADGTGVPGEDIGPYYNPAANSFKYCQIGGSSKSEFQIATIVAHELSHSISPCGITQGSSGRVFNYPAGSTREEAELAHPFGPILQCLRKGSSMSAVSATTRAGSRYRTFCGGDQIEESFPDWMAAEIIPGYIEKNFSSLSQDQRRQGYANVMRGLCAPVPPSFDEHPSTARRANFVLGMQPQVRAQMGCGKTPSGRAYCSVKKPAVVIPAIARQSPTLDDSDSTTLLWTPGARR
jgi:hypothetical protein